MAETIDENGNITTYQGDTIEIPITGLDTSKNYTLYCQIRNEAHKPIGEQISKQSNYSPDVSLEFPTTTSDLLVVPPDQDYEIYYYGIKAVFDGKEDTLFLVPAENANFGIRNTITVYAKKVDGP